MPQMTDFYTNIFISFSQWIEPLCVVQGLIQVLSLSSTEEERKKCGKSKLFKKRQKKDDRKITGNQRLPKNYKKKQYLFLEQLFIYDSVFWTEFVFDKYDKYKISIYIDKISYNKYPIFQSTQKFMNESFLKNMVIDSFCSLIKSKQLFKTQENPEISSTSSKGYESSSFFQKRA